MHTRTLSLGILFGFVLSRAGATSYDAIRGMFRLTVGDCVMEAKGRE